VNCVKAAMFLGSADPIMDEVLHRGRQGSLRFVLKQLLFFLAEVPHCKFALVAKKKQLFFVHSHYLPLMVLNGQTERFAHGFGRSVGSRLWLPLTSEFPVAIAPAEEYASPILKTLG